MLYEPRFLWHTNSVFLGGEGGLQYVESRVLAMQPIFTSYARFFTCIRPIWCQRIAIQRKPGLDNSSTQAARHMFSWLTRFGVDNVHAQNPVPYEPQLTHIFVAIYWAYPGQLMSLWARSCQQPPKRSVHHALRKGLATRTGREREREREW